MLLGDCVIFTNWLSVLIHSLPGTKSQLREIVHPNPNPNHLETVHPWEISKLLRALILKT